MTFSILAKDPETGEIGGAAVTGSLCVGGWVLRGNPRAGMSASQGTAPSTLWGEQVIRIMEDGGSAREAVERVTGSDSGRHYRQLAVIDSQGNTRVFTGRENEPVLGGETFENGVVAGNMLANEEVLQVMARTYQLSNGNIARRLLNAIQSAHAAGGDYRGAMSAAMLVVSKNHPPLDLRVDQHPEPVARLAELFSASQESHYNSWLHRLPTISDPERAIE